MSARPVRQRPDGFDTLALTMNVAKLENHYCASARLVQRWIEAMPPRLRTKRIEMLYQERRDRSLKADSARHLPAKIKLSRDHELVVWHESEWAFRAADADALFRQVWARALPNLRKLAA